VRELNRFAGARGLDLLNLRRRVGGGRDYE
jgi:hypothetical protein